MNGCAKIYERKLHMHTTMFTPRHTIYGNSFSSSVTTGFCVRVCAIADDDDCFAGMGVSETDI